MKLDEILDLWKIDSVIDKTEISSESIKFTKLHEKYHRIYANEKLIHRKLDGDLKKLKLAKYEFYTQGPNEESEKLGWKLPPIGKILRTDVSLYMDGDNEIIALSLRIGIQLEKLNLLESIIKALKDRGFSIKNYIDWQKFINGAQ